MTIDGNIGEATPGRSLSLTDQGTLVLAGTDNTYTGGTCVEHGTLIVNNRGAIMDETSLTIGADGVFIFDPTAGGGVPAAAPYVVSAGPVAPVPEPGTLSLLAVGAALAVLYRRRSQR